MLLDSWAWVEMFKDTLKGRKVRKTIGESTIFLSVLNIAEVADWCVREGKNPKAYVTAMKENTNLLIIDEEIAETAGNAISSLRKQSPGIGLIDVLIYSLAQSAQMPLVTGDPHFRNLTGVEFID